MILTVQHPSKGVQGVAVGVQPKGKQGEFTDLKVFLEPFMVLFENHGVGGTTPTEGLHAKR